MSQKLVSDKHSKTCIVLPNFHPVLLRTARTELLDARDVSIILPLFLFLEYDGFMIESSSLRTLINGAKKLSMLSYYNFQCSVNLHLTFLNLPLIQYA